MANTPNEELDPRIDFAVQRTQLAWDRTLLAWVRTALSLLAAGVAFDKGIKFLHEAREAAGTAWLHSAHVVGLTVASVSTLLLAIVVWHHLRAVRELAGTRHRDPPRVTTASVVGVLVVILGCAVLVVLLMSNK